MDPLLRSAQRDAKNALQDANRLLKRGGKIISSTARQEVEQAIENLRSCDGPSALIQERIRTLEHTIDKHLAFARKSKAREYVESIGVAVLVALTIRAFIFEPFKIPSPSMVPTLDVGDRLYVSKARYGIRVPFTSKYLVQWRELHRGDIVVFEFPRKQAVTRDRIGQWMQLLELSSKPYPATLQELAADNPYATIDNASYKDAWGNALQYSLQDNTGEYSIKSAGSDGVAGTPDDLTSDMVKDSFLAFPDIRRPEKGEYMHRCPVDEGSLTETRAYIKRVIGLPGDVVELKRNQLYINGNVVERTFLRQEGSIDTRIGELRPTRYQEQLRDEELTYTTRILFDDERFGPVTVPDDQFLAMGDNRDQSSDGRCWGFTPIGQVRGQAKFVLFSVKPQGGFDTERFFKVLH